MAYTGMDETAEYRITAAPNLQFDEVTGGGFDYEEGGVDHHDGLAGQDFVTRPMVMPIGNVDTFLATHDILARCKRASYRVLPPSIALIEGGVRGTALGARRQTLCEIDSVEIGCEENGAVTVNYAWKSKTDEPVNLGAAATPKSRSLYFYWHGATVTFALGTFKCQSFTATLKNNITGWCSLDAKGAGLQRLPEELKVGNMQVSLSAVFRMPTGYDLTDDLPTRVGFVFTAKNQKLVVQTFTLNLSGGQKLSVSSDPVKLESSADEVTWAIEAESDDNDLAVWATSIAP